MNTGDVIGVLTVIIVLATLIFYLGIGTGEKYAHNEAVRNQVAYYVATDDGNTVFHWITPTDPRRWVVVTNNISTNR